MTTVITRPHDTVDLICRRHYGDESGYAEAVYDANRGLATYGPHLPAGLVVILPEVILTGAADAVVRLWD